MDVSSTFRPETDSGPNFLPRATVPAADDGAGAGPDGAHPAHGSSSGLSPTADAYAPSHAAHEPNHAEFQAWAHVDANVQHVHVPFDAQLESGTFVSPPHVAYMPAQFGQLDASPLYQHAQPHNTPVQQQQHMQQLPWPAPGASHAPFSPAPMRGASNAPPEDQSIIMLRAQLAAAHAMLQSRAR